MTEVPIVTAATREIKSILGDHLGATLVESTHPLWTPDPEIETMKTDFRARIGAARARLDARPAVPPRPQRPAAVHRIRRRRRADRVLPGKVFGSGTMKPIDYCVALAEGRIAPPKNLDLATIQQQELAMTFRFHMSNISAVVPPTGKSAVFTETLDDFATLNARSKYWGDDQRAAFKNWEDIADPRNPLGGRQGSTNGSCCVSCCGGPT